MPTTRHLLSAHWQRATDAIERTQWRTPEHKAAHAAADCAALHIGLDTMGRLQAKRRGRAGYLESYPPIARRDAYEVADALDDVLRAHSARTPYALGGHPAWHVAEHYTATLG